VCDVFYGSLQGAYRPGCSRRLRGRALRRALPHARITGTGFTGVLAVLADGDPTALAARASDARGQAIGRVVASPG
jgi:hypothetical protein